MSEEYTADDDAASLQLSRDVRAELANALNSMGGYVNKSALDKFLLYSADQMNKAVDAYIFLRETGRIDASKLLVRPLIEMMFRACAVANQPKLFYRMILTERLKRNAMIERAAKRQKKEYDRTVEAHHWEVFRDQCLKTVPETDLTDEALSVRAEAKAANMIGYYEGFYAMYCAYTHGAFEAILGLLDPLSDAFDNRVVALAAFATVEVLKEHGAKCPNFNSLLQRLKLPEEPEVEVLA